MRFKTAALALALLVTGAFAAHGKDIKQLDKDIFDRLAAKADETVNVTVDGSLLKFAAKFASMDDGEDGAKLKKLLDGLSSVMVRSYTFKSKGQYSADDVAEIRKQLKGGEWQRIVEVHNKTERSGAEIYILPGHGSSDPKPEGLLIISAEELELTVVHIMGRIDLNDLASLEDLGVPEITKDGHVVKGDK